MSRPLWVGLLLLMLLGTTLLGAQIWQGQAVERQLTEQSLARSLPAQAQLEAFRAESLQLRARTLGDEQSFVAYVALALDVQPGSTSIDSSSVADLLRERVEQLGFDLAAVLAADGSVLASSDALLARGSQPIQAELLEQATATDRGATGLLLLADKPLLVSVNLMQRGGSFDGHLLTGVYLRSELLDGLAGAVGTSVGLFHLGAERIRPLTGDASLAGRLDEVAIALRNAVLSDDSLVDGIDQPHRLQLRLGQRQTAVLLSPAFADRRHVWLFVPSAGDAAMESLLRLPWLLACSLIVLLLALYLGWQQRALWSPLQGLAVQLEGAARGDFRRQLAVQGDPLVQRITIAFNQLMQRLRS